MAEIDLDDLSTPEHGYTVNDDKDDEPVLLDRHGNPVETWRERYPYDHRMPREEYEWLKRRLQIELLKLQNHSRRTGARHLILFEGRDAAGKGGTIQRFMEHSIPGRTGGGARQAVRTRTDAVVFPALCQPSAGRRRDGVVRPVVV